MAMLKLSRAAQAAITDIARRALKVETPGVRDSDRLGFHELPVRAIQIALETAYLCGMADGYCRDPPGGGV